MPRLTLADVLHNLLILWMNSIESWVSSFGIGIVRSQLRDREPHWEILMIEVVRRALRSFVTKSMPELSVGRSRTKSES